MSAAEQAPLRIRVIILKNVGKVIYRSGKWAPRSERVDKVHVDIEVGERSGLCGGICVLFAVGDIEVKRCGTCRS